MNIPLPQTPTVCRMLRTKTAFGTFEGAPHEWHTGESTTAVYWCLHTMATAGPDHHYAHPETCAGAGRGCYQKPTE
jgi:hypothetical protein